VTEPKEASVAAEVSGWLMELGLKPVESAEREDMSSWDLLLDGKKRLAIRFTVIHQPALGAVVWVHYAPPLADSLRKTYVQLLHWNDELPFVKFAVAEEERLTLSAEIAAPFLTRDALGLALARLLAVCDLLYADSAAWVDRLGKPEAAGSGEGARLLDRYAHDLGELVTPDYDEVRTAARVLLIDPQNRVLLLGARDPGDDKVVWFVPGGGVEGNETLEEAAQRELLEEVPQAQGVQLRGPVWQRHHDFSWNRRRISQTEFFFVGRLESGFPAESVEVGGAEAQFFEGAKWASADELAMFPPETIMAPSRLPELLPPILAGDLPTTPIDTGV
jgi:8-oxo-dGTP pyrophosphatase MutT (NUDIX family)